MKFAILGVALLLVFTDARKIKFEDCSNGVNMADVLYVDVEPCAEEPCIFQKGTVATMTAALKGNKRNVDAASIEVTVDMDDIEVPYPGVETDVCKKLDCPLVMGKTYELKYELPVEDFFPEMLTYMKWVATEDSTGEQIICAKAKIGVKD